MLALGGDRRHVGLECLINFWQESSDLISYLEGCQYGGSFFFAFPPLDKSVSRLGAEYLK